MEDMLSNTTTPGPNDTSSFLSFRTTEHAVAHVLLFFILCAPPLLLNSFNGLALLNSSSISLPIKISLLNVILSNIVYLVGVGMYFLGFVIKVLGGLEGTAASCQLFLAVYTWGSLLRLVALPMFGVVAFVIIKSGIDSVRVKLLVFSCAVLWIVALGWSLVVFSPLYRVLPSSDGVRCIIDVPSGTFSPVYLHVGISAVGIGVLGLVIAFVLTLKAYLYTRGTHSDDLALFRKALVKYLTLLIALNIVNVFGFLIIGPLRGKSDHIQALLYHYIPFIVFSSMANLNPWVMIWVFKHLRERLKTWAKCECGNLMKISQAYNRSRLKVRPVPASSDQTCVSLPYTQTSVDFIPTQIVATATALKKSSN